MSAAKQQAMPWGALSGDRLPDWETPWALYREIERRYAHGARFTVDVCASDSNAKCPRHFTAERSCLEHPWGEVGSAEVAWLQPPFGEIGQMVARAVEQLDQRRIVQCVGFFPARTDRAWWDRFITRRAARVILPRGRATFVPPEGFDGKVTSHAEPMAIVIWEHPLELPPLCRDQPRPDLLGVLIEARKEMAAQGVELDPLKLIKELDR